MPRRIAVLAEHKNGELSEVTYELLAAGRRIAQSEQDRLEAVLFGEGVEPLSAGLGAADTVLLLEHPGWTFPFTSESVAPLAAVIRERDVDLVLVAGTNVSMGLGTGLAAFLGAGFVNFCTGLRDEAGSVILTSRLFGGKIVTESRLRENRGVVSVYPGSFPVEEGRGEGCPPVERIRAAVEAPKIKFLTFIEPQAGDVDITKQDILVSVGRGIQSQDNIELAEELAQVLGTVVSSSRPVVDQGWLPLTRQVGKSGMIVKPRLYLALGISGAPEHQEGMKNAKTIVAVNTDPKAPIFDIANFGAVADLFEVVPALIDVLKRKKVESRGG